MTEYPLTEAQAGLWYAQRLAPENAIYNTGQYVDIRGPLNVGAFHGALKRTLAESDALAIRVVEKEDALYGVVDDALRADLQIIDMRDSAFPEIEARAWIDRDMSTPLDLTKGPLVAEMLFVLAPERHFWYQRIHHLVIDGYGVALLTSRIWDLYASAVSSAPAKTSPFGSFASVIAEDAAYRESSRRAADRDYWQKQFEDRPNVPAIKAGPAITATTFWRKRRDLPATFGARLAQRCQESETTWPDFLVAVIAAYIHRHGGTAETIVGVPSMNRLGSASAHVPAMIMNVLPIRVKPDENIPFPSFLASVARQLNRARRHGRYRSEQLRRDLNMLGEQRRIHGPLINVLPFEFLSEVPNIETTLHLLGTGAVDDLTFTIRAKPDLSHVSVELDANPSLYQEDEIAEHVERLATFLENAAACASLADVPTLTPQERRHWIFNVNNTRHPVEPVTLTTLIERTMRTSPDAPAVLFGSQTWTYGELDAATIALAQQLAAAGVQRGDIVAVGLPRSFELVASLVAVLRAGAAYLPMDLDHPAARLSAVLESARPRLVLTVERFRELWPADLALLFLDEHLAQDTVPGVSESPQPEDRAYVIYTSGSTGVPKGVVIDHRAIVNRLEWMRIHYGIAADDRILQKTPATFDVSVWEFFLPLISGAALVVAPPDAHKDPTAIAGLFREYRITTAHFVPSMLAAFLADPAATGITMRRVFCSGEELSSQLRDRFHAVMSAELHNLYGPTEAAVDVTYWPAFPADKSVPVPIGFPVWNTGMYILDEHLRPVAPEVTGHLFIAGVQLAREYLRRPDLTAERFVDNPFHPGERMYKTGDIARWRRDGAIVFLGRSDHQIKIRGFRIELGEIEAAIASSGLVSQVAAIAREDRPGDRRIVAYVSPAKEAANVDLEVLRRHVASRVPDYMIPSAFMVLSDFPVTSNGKLDRTLLPKPEHGGATVSRPPETDTERRLAELFSEILGSRAGVDDDFFLLGGHSLLAIRLVNRVRQEWACKLSLGVIFANPTVAQMAAHLEMVAAGSKPERTEQEGLGKIITLVRGTSPAPPLYCIHPAGGISWCYAALAREFAKAGDLRAVYGIQAAGLDSNSAIPESLTAMAANYVSEIRRTHPGGPFHLAGWSVGGIIAQAMAVDLRSRGLDVGVVALLDAYPSDRWRDQAPPDESAALKALLYIAGCDPETLGPGPVTRAGVKDFLRRSGTALGELSDEALNGVIRVVESTSGMVRKHHHEKFDGTLLYFRAALDHQTDSLTPSDWAPYAAALEVHEISAKHPQMVSASAARVIALVISQYL